MDFHLSDCDCEECGPFNEWAERRLAEAKARNPEFMNIEPTVLLTDDDSDFCFERAEARAVDEVNKEKKVIPSPSELEAWLAL
jgi:hypothetical protein